MFARMICGVMAVMVSVTIAAAADAPVKEDKVTAVPADEAWTDAVRFADKKGKMSRGWTWRHEDSNRKLLEAVPGENLLLDDQNKTTGKGSIHMRFLSAEAKQIRNDIASTVPRQIYNELNLPGAPVDVSKTDRIAFDIRCQPEGAVVAVRMLFRQQFEKGGKDILCFGPVMPLTCGEKWTRFEMPLAAIRRVMLTPGGGKIDAPDWTKCRQVVIDVRIAMAALNQAEHVDLWIDNLRFEKTPKE